MSSPPRELEIVVATPAEQRARDVLCHEAWGDRLSVEAFVAREEQLRATAFARERLTPWLLVARGDPARTVLASLETYAMDSRHGPRPGATHAVASVYTAPALRGRGYATTLLVEVGRRLGAAPRAQAMILYSDVGAALYERAGYRARAAFDWVWPAARAAAAGVARADGEPAVAAVLGTHAPRGRFALLPDAAQIDWHRARERAYAALLGGAPVAHGVLRCDGGDALLAGDLRHGRLLVLAWWARDRRAADALCAASADEARHAGLADVVAWADPDGGEAERAFGEAVRRRGGGRVARAGALPMIAPLPGAPALTSEAWREIPRALWV